MKTAIRSLLAVTLLAGLSVPAAAEIRWYTDLKQASEAAQKANLPMFIDFWADWCAPCNIMDAEVYPDPRVIRAFEDKAIGVRIHYDLQPDLVRRYNVPALPYLLFTNSHGTPLIHSRGLIEAEDLAKIIDAMPPLAMINEIDRALQRSRDDVTMLVAMGRELRAAAFWEASNTFYDRALKHRVMRNDAALREAVSYNVALNWLELQDGRKAAELLQRWLKDFPKSTRRDEALVALDRARALN
jgi:thioredoxin-like negative regulator of GroEL